MVADRGGQPCEHFKQEVSMTSKATPAWAGQRNALPHRAHALPFSTSKKWRIARRWNGSAGISCLPV